MRSLRRLAVVIVAFGIAIIAWRLRPGGLPSGGPADAAIVWACQWIGCALAGYLAAALSLAALTTPVRRCDPTPRLSRLAPGSLRRAVHGFVAAGLVTAIAGSGAAVALPRQLAAATAHAPHRSGDPLDWPGLTGTSTAAPRPAPSRASRRPPPKPVVEAPTGPRGGDVLVRPGDSLWAIAARHLGRDATPAEVAAAWPGWYAANRRVIGDDPDLIRPGQRLRPPAAEHAA